MSETAITWGERVANLTKALGRKPTFAELLDVSSIHHLTPAERQAQNESLVRAMRPTGDPRLD
ncbi:hypothetical protein [Bosea vaviloviae]|uniref:hypothetical protein n=1 Tax=Bosea vaviloviae TaxID=1526658 RepID=UPI000A867841|nr:hypothetical protein [Bosea vaviloviae]